MVLLEDARVFRLIACYYAP